MIKRTFSADFPNRPVPEGGASEYFVSGIYVHATGSEPTEADVAEFINPTIDLDALDTATLNAKLLAPGSVDRAELKTLFNHENRIRALESKPAITQTQFVDALKAVMRNGV